ncbi:DNA cytosine methyltransferase [Enterococcus faecium]|nr:DNA cytosine methyltransferase [Enterococcus faecium]NTM44521.1 DNA cytosine methyltransferase [Enterococcus faecium]NTN05881.1 DNA cytosine methyltransferase [Enterococcus faecium]NTN20414.1 DNA cytosine methyltransferase [Enterococcus faecium]
MLVSTKSCLRFDTNTNLRVSIREIVRIQSFPDSYIFVGSSLSAKYKVIGNAVLPKLAKVIGDSIVKQLSESNF